MQSTSAKGHVTRSGARNVLMVATSYPADRADWHGVFIRHIADALARREDIALSLWAPPGELGPNVIRVATGSDDAWLSRLVARGGIAQLLRNHKLSGIVAAATLLRRLGFTYRRNHADLYHVNWIQNALALPDDGKPAVVTALGADMRILHWPLIARMLRRTFRKRNVAICPNADWMAKPLRALFGDVAQVLPVPFGIDRDWYAIQREIEARDEKIWLVVSRITHDKIGPLFAWCEPLFAGTTRKLHLFGPLLDAVTIPDWVVCHGPATQAQLRDTWFPRAQGLITLSQHAEGRPQVMLEAMASGLPIIASRLPAHLDLLAHGKTGWLVDHPSDLATAIMQLEDAVANHAIGQAARAFVAREFGTWDDCAHRYNEAYLRLLGADAS